MPKKKTKKAKHVLRPWCWYCERDFEDEKVLMQHQKAKHFKCGHCPRKLNTAGGLAVHIQQVHKLDPEPIENALPGRTGYDIEIFGMEGIPVADIANYRRKKEAEFNLPVGYFGNKNITGAPGAPGQGGAKRNYENRVYTFNELGNMLETHRQLMGRGEEANQMDVTTDGPVLLAGPQTYAAPTLSGLGLPPSMPGMPPLGGMPGLPPPGGLPPMPPLSMTGPPGQPPLPLQFPPPGFPMPPPGMAGAPPFPPGQLPPGFPPFPLPPPEALGQPTALPTGLPGSGLPGGTSNAQGAQSNFPPISGPPSSSLPSITGPNVSKPPGSNAMQTGGNSPVKRPMIGRSGGSGSVPTSATFDPTAVGLKEGTVLEWMDMNYSPLERRADDPTYSQRSDDVEMSDGAAGRRARARAEDFLD